MKTMVTLIADEGKVITNGTDYGTTISLAEGADASNFHEITMEEYNEILDAMSAEAENGEEQE